MRAGGSTTLQLSLLLLVLLPISAALIFVTITLKSKHFALGLTLNARNRQSSHVPVLLSCGRLESLNSAQYNGLNN